MSARASKFLSCHACAGLGDVAVPGLLACLALRYDASRATDMRARALAAADALKDSLASMQVPPLASSPRVLQL